MFWAEKYRPTGIQDIFGQDALVAEIQAIIDGKAPMQHYLFYSPEPGTGKTSMAYALASDLDYTIHKFNASSKKQRGIEFIEEDLAPMTRIGQYEMIYFLDEADQLTSAAQSALTGVIEDSQGWFILTCNNLQKVTPYLQSRCQVRRFMPINEKAMWKTLTHISVEEGLQVPSEHLERIILTHNGDLRNAIGALQAYGTIPEENREQFTLGLGAGEVDCLKVLSFCFKMVCVEDAVTEMKKATTIKDAIDAVFKVAMNSSVNPEKKMIVVDAAITARRDLLMGVEEEFVVWDFCRRLST